MTLMNLTFHRRSKEDEDEDEDEDATLGEEDDADEEADPRVAAPHIIAAYLLRLPVQPHARHQGVGL